MAIYANLIIDQGSEFTTTVTVTEAGSGDLTDLTGYLVRAQMRKSYASQTSYDFEAFASDPESGTLKITLDSATSGALKPGRYVYDIEIESGTGAVTRVVEGQIEVTPRVTRP